MKPILVINSGSSSLKYQLIDASTGSAIQSGLIERVEDHGSAFQEMISALGNVKPVAIGHRVVHGGSKFAKPVLIDAEVIAQIEDLSSLAPLHNPGNAAGIRSAFEAFPGLPQVAVFDTAFHQTMPVESYRYAIDRELADRFEIRRYGFHGTSHEFVASRSAEFLGIQKDSLNAIILHLGNGGSACAIKAGKSINTSMGLTPLEGLVMGTRSGDIDPAIVAYLSRVADMSIDEIDASLNKNSGLKGLTGNSDLRDVIERAEAGEKVAIDALATYALRVKHYIGSYLAQIGKIDALIFTAGVGENSAVMRGQIIEGLNHLGLALDTEKNNTRASDPREISLAGSAIKILVVPTNEELEIAIQTMSLIAT